MSNKVLFAVIALIILGLGVIVLRGGDSATETTDGDTASVANQRSQNIYGLPLDESEVVLQEAYSLGCPACAQYHPVLKEIREEFKDKITFQVVHFPLTANFQNALAAHRAVEAAGRQNKFWEMHDKLFEERDLWTYNQASSNPITNPVPQMNLFAEELELDVDKFKADFRSEQVNDIINNDSNYLSDEKNVDTTPTFILNGEVVDSNNFSSAEAARATLNEALGIEEDESADEATDEADTATEADSTE